MTRLLNAKERVGLAVLTVVACVLMLALVLSLTGCTTAQIRSMDNGSSGAETWSIPVPAWPSLAAPDLGCD